VPSQWGGQRPQAPQQPWPAGQQWPPPQRSWPQQPQPARSSGIGGRLARASIPVWSLGFLSFVPFLILAAARKRRKDWLILAGYVVAVAAEITAVAATAHTPGAGSVVAGLLVLVLMFGGATHAFVDDNLTRPGTVPPGTAREANEQAMAAAHARMKRREEAREIASRDPVLRSELRIGRPDLTRSYDDGGLVDVNQVPSWVLSSHLGLSPQEAAAAVAARANLGRFVSSAEVSQYAQFAPDRLDAIQDWMIFS
jgi:hypothetical protein